LGRGGGRERPCYIGADSRIASVVNRSARGLLAVRQYA